MRLRKQTSKGTSTFRRPRFIKWFSRWRPAAILSAHLVKQDRSASLFQYPACLCSHEPLACKAPVKQLNAKSSRRRRGFRAARWPCAQAQRQSRAPAQAPANTPAPPALAGVASKAKYTSLQCCRHLTIPSSERTFQRPLRTLWPAAHVKR